MNSSFLFEHSSPGTTTCILVGGLRGVERVEFEGLRSILWFVDAASAGGVPAGLDPKLVHVVDIQKLPAEAMDPLLERFVLADPRRLPRLCVTHEVTRHHVDEYNNLVGHIQSVFERTHRSRLTRQDEGFLWQKQLLVNLPTYLRKRVPRSWAGFLKGIPGFVCGAGPSLDVSAPVLASVCERGFVFSADSALRALARYDIQADFVVSVDAAKLPEKCLSEDTDPAKLVMSGISPPAWRSALPDDRIAFLSGRQLTEDWLAEMGVSKTAVTVRGNCGLTAVELAHYLGCSPIVLFGMDMASSPDQPGRRHTFDSDPSIERGSGFESQTEFFTVPGNFDERVPTFMFGELNVLNAELARFPQGYVINVNDRGARLENVTLKTPADFHVKFPECDKRKMLSLLPAFETESLETLRAAMSELGSAGAKGCRLAASARAALDGNEVAAAASMLRELFATGNFGRSMGAFALKVMPHLTPPVSGDPAFWRGLIDELEELSCLAQADYEVSVV